MSQGVAKERVKLSGPYRNVSIVGCRVLYQGDRRKFFGLFKFEHRNYLSF